MSEKIEYFVDLDELEDKVIAMRVHSAIIYCYPFKEEVAKHGAKIMTASGKVVKHVQPATRGCDDVFPQERIIIGELDGERLVWDTDGNLLGDDKDGSMRLCIPERYFMRNWKSIIKLSNGEFALKYQRPHPNVKIPDAWEERAKRNHEG